MQSLMINNLNIFIKNTKDKNKNKLFIEQKFYNRILN